MATKTCCSRKGKRAAKSPTQVEQVIPAETFQCAQQNVQLSGKPSCISLNSSLVKSVPRNKRSKRGDENKKGLDVANELKLNNQLLNVKPKKSRARKKRKCKDIHDPSDDEVISQSSLHWRGQSRRRCESSALGKLDSVTFELYREKIWRAFPEEKRSSFTCLDSLWYHLYTDRTTKAKVLDWIKKKEIFSKKYVLVPIVRWGHWCLLIMCNMGKSFESESETPCLLLLDSMQAAHAKQLESGIRKFVSDLYSAGEKTVTTKMIKKIPFQIPKVPQQRNGEECGYYVLYFIHLFLGHAPDDFSLAEGYPYFMKNDWFSPEELDAFSKQLESSSKEESSDAEKSSSDSDPIELSGGSIS
ncbi:unnamed protein product [Cuscuta campestris]|uniref:Ubiquitin-like protease family profile domain-containing protein n=1 Tax=Cuscuta campestris TaxID=132261 RepID=A0A484NN33_9ASTE|nr:unnamed protein product [Cuscuta campestris]